MEQNIRITTIQTSLHWENKAANLAMFDEKMSQLHQKTDIIVLPEMFTTGFSMNTKLAETMDGATVSWLRQKSKELDAAVLGSFICAENDTFLNRLVWAQPDGEIKTYDKKHLFCLAEESKYYTAGNEKIIINWRNWRILPLICYDVRFPNWSRNNSEQPYDLLIYIANFAAARSHAWKTLLAARAIENQCFTVGVNIVGTDGNNIFFSGDTKILDYEGHFIYRANDSEDIFTMSLSKEKLNNFRTQFPFLKDADKG